MTLKKVITTGKKLDRIFVKKESIQEIHDQIRSKRAVTIMITISRMRRFFVILLLIIERTFSFWTAFQVRIWMARITAFTKYRIEPFSWTKAFTFTILTLVIIRLPVTVVTVTQELQQRQIRREFTETTQKRALLTKM